MAGGRTNKEKRRVLYDAQKGKCVFCGRFCRFEGRGGEPMLFTNEHVVPLYFGGTRSNNIVGACFQCNLKRASVINRAPKSGHKSIFISRFQEQQRFKKRGMTYTCRLKGGPYP